MQFFIGEEINLIQDIIIIDSNSFEDIFLVEEVQMNDISE